MARKASLLDHAQFAAWFGQSTVRNRWNRPQVVYHATVREFSTFDPGLSKDFGLHFGTYRAANKRLVNTGQLDAAGAHLLPVYLRIENPVIMTDYGDWHVDQVLAGLKAQGHLDSDRHAQLCKQLPTDTELRALLAELKIDGIVYRNEIEGGTSYIVFSPNQIKSAIGNSGAYDLANPAIHC